MRKKFKYIHIMLMSFMTFALMSCSSVQDNSETDCMVIDQPSTKPSYLDDTSAITFDWYVNFPWFLKKWGGDATSEYITDKTGVSINFIVPSGNANEKIEAMIATNTLPDFITLGCWEGKINDMIEVDLVYALDSLAEQYDAYFMQVASPERIKWYTKSDGHVYAYPNASYTAKDYEDMPMTSNQTFLVRKDIYEAIGSPEMRTPEGFLAALRKATELFPTVDGQPLIPIGLYEFTDAGCDSLEDYLQNFLAIPRVDEAGNLYDRDTDSEYVRWLKVMRQAHEEGLLAIDLFIDGRTQMQEKIEEGRYFSMLYQRSDLTAQNNTRYLEDPSGVYIAVDGPANANLDPPELDGGGIAGWTVTLISKNCKDPERAIKFLSYMLSEEAQLDFYMGPEGATFEYVAGIPTWLPEVKKILDQNRTQFDNVYGAAYTYWMLMDSPMSKKWETEPVEPSAQPYKWSQGKAVNTNAFYNLSLEAGSTLDIEFLRIQAKWGEVLPGLIQAESEASFDQIFCDFLKYREAHKWLEIVAYQQQQFEVNLEKLGE